MVKTKIADRTTDSKMSGSSANIAVALKKPTIPLAKRPASPHLSDSDGPSSPSITDESPRTPSKKSIGLSSTDTQFRRDLRSGSVAIQGHKPLMQNLDGKTSLTYETKPEEDEYVKTQLGLSEKEASRIIPLLDQHFSQGSACQEITIPLMTGTLPLFKFLKEKFGEEFSWRKKFTYHLQKKPDSPIITEEIIFPSIQLTSAGDIPCTITLPGELKLSLEMDTEADDIATQAPHTGFKYKSHQCGSQRADAMEAETQCLETLINPKTPISEFSDIPLIVRGQIESEYDKLKTVRIEKLLVFIERIIQDESYWKKANKADKTKKIPDSIKTLKLLLEDGKFKQNTPHGRMIDIQAIAQNALEDPVQLILQEQTFWRAITFDLDQTSLREFDGKIPPKNLSTDETINLLALLQEIETILAEPFIWLPFHRDKMIHKPSKKMSDEIPRAITQIADLLKNTQKINPQARLMALRAQANTILKTFKDYITEEEEEFLKKLANIKKFSQKSVKTFLGVRKKVEAARKEYCSTLLDSISDIVTAPGNQYWETKPRSIQTLEKEFNLRIPRERDSIIFPDIIKFAETEAPKARDLKTQTFYLFIAAAEKYRADTDRFDQRIHLIFPVVHFLARIISLIKNPPFPHSKDFQLLQTRISTDSFLRLSPTDQILQMREQAHAILEIKTKEKALSELSKEEITLYNALILAGNVMVNDFSTDFPSQNSAMEYILTELLPDIEKTQEGYRPIKPSQ